MLHFLDFECFKKLKLRDDIDLKELKKYRF